MNNLYINQNIRFSHAKGFIVAVLSNNKVIPLIEFHMKILKFIEMVSYYNQVCSYINTINPNVDSQKVIDRFLKNGILQQEKNICYWENASYGAGLIDELEEKAVINTLRSKKLFRYENISLSGYKYQPTSNIDIFENKMKKILKCKYFSAVSS